MIFFVFRTVKSRPNVQLEYNKCPGIQAARSFIGIRANVVGMRDYSCWCPACIRAVGRDKGGMNSDLVVKHCSSPASGHDLSEVYTSACTCTRMHANACIHTCAHAHMLCYACYAMLHMHACYATLRMRTCYATHAMLLCYAMLCYACTHAHMHVHTHVAVGGALC